MSNLLLDIGRAVNPYNLGLLAETLSDRMKSVYDYSSREEPEHIKSATVCLLTLSCRMSDKGYLDFATYLQFFTDLAQAKRIGPSECLFKPSDNMATIYIDIAAVRKASLNPLMNDYPTLSMYEFANILSEFSLNGKTEFLEPLTERKAA